MHDSFFRRMYKLTSDSSYVQVSADDCDRLQPHNATNLEIWGAGSTTEQQTEYKKMHHIPLFTFETASSKGLYLNRVASNSLFVIVSASNMPPIYANQPRSFAQFVPQGPHGIRVDIALCRDSCCVVLAIPPHKPRSSAYSSIAPMVMVAQTYTETEVRRLQCAGMLEWRNGVQPNDECTHAAFHVLVVEEGKRT